MLTYLRQMFEGLDGLSLEAVSSPAREAAPLKLGAHRSPAPLSHTSAPDWFCGYRRFFSCEPGWNTT